MPILLADDRTATRVCRMTFTLIVKSESAAVARTLLPVSVPAMPLKDPLWLSTMVEIFPVVPFKMLHSTPVIPSSDPERAPETANADAKPDGGNEAVRSLTRAETMCDKPFRILSSVLPFKHDRMLFKAPVMIADRLSAML